MVEHLLNELKKDKKKIRALSKNKDKATLKDISDEIIEDNHIVTDRLTGMMYLYNEKEHYYEYECALDDIRTIIVDELDDLYTKNKVTEILEYIRLKTRLPLNNGYNDLVCFNNGIYNVLTDELMEHSPKLFVSFRVKTNYIPDKDTTEWDGYITDVVDRGDILKCQEAYGNIFAPNYTTKKLFMHIGKQHSGKTKFCEILMDLLSKKNYSTLTLHDFSSSYNVADLYGKRANFGGDIDAEKMFKSTALIKRLTGGDALQARKIYCAPFSFVNHSKLFLSGNYVPRVEKDVDPIFTGRFEFITHHKRFKKDETVFDTYTTNDMKEQQVKWMVDGYRRLKKNRWIFTNQLGYEDLIEIFRLKKYIKPGFLDWLLSCTVDKDSIVPTNDLCRECFDWCEMHGKEHPLNVTQFGKMLNDQQIVQVTGVRVKGVYCYKGIKL